MTNEYRESLRWYGEVQEREKNLSAIPLEQIPEEEIIIFLRYIKDSIPLMYSVEQRQWARLANRKWGLQLQLVRNKARPSNSGNVWSSGEGYTGYLGFEHNERRGLAYDVLCSISDNAPRELFDLNGLEKMADEVDKMEAESREEAK